MCRVYDGPVDVSLYSINDVNAKINVDVYKSRDKSREAGRCQLKRWVSIQALVRLGLAPEAASGEVEASRVAVRAACPALNPDEPDKPPECSCVTEEAPVSLDAVLLGAPN